jgi:uncharacterized protein DUF732
LSHALLGEGREIIVKTPLVAAFVAAVWLAPTAYADLQDQAFLSYLAANGVAVDANTGINAAHMACAQIADGESPSMVNAIILRQFPTIGGNEYWITAGARQAYCPKEPELTA